jgi:hypothetical protein
MIGSALNKECQAYKKHQFRTNMVIAVLKESGNEEAKAAYDQISKQVRDTIKSYKSECEAKSANAGSTNSWEISVSISQTGHVQRTTPDFPVKIGKILP